MGSVSLAAGSETAKTLQSYFATSYVRKYHLLAIPEYRCILQAVFFDMLLYKRNYQKIFLRHSRLSHRCMD